MKSPLEQLGNIPVTAATLESLFPNIKGGNQKIRLLERDKQVIRLKRGLYVCDPNVTGIALSTERMKPESRKSSKEDVLYNLGLIKDGIPTNGAVPLFGKYPKRKFVTSSFKIGRFGADDADLLSQDQIEANLIQMTDKIMQVLSSKYLIRPIHYEGLQRKEPLEIPEDALREIIFNSIVHKLQFGGGIR